VVWSIINLILYCYITVWSNINLIFYCYVQGWINPWAKGAAALGPRFHRAPTFDLEFFGSGKPIERFIIFLDICGHGAANLAEVFTNIIEDVGLQIGDCRGQS